MQKWGKNKRNERKKTMNGRKKENSKILKMLQQGERD